MSAGWTAFVAILVVLNILGCVWLLWWTSKRRADSAPEAETTGHHWDDDLTEYNKPLPRWWLNLFYLTIVFAVVYLVLYPGLGSWRGSQQWSSSGELAKESALVDARMHAAYARFDALTLDQLTTHPEALALGGSLYATHCAACHGADARGAKGYPNLTDGDWLWGGTPERVLETVLDGRHGVMPALGAALGDDGVIETAVYVQALAGGAADRLVAKRGQARYASLCIGCHGVDGSGNSTLGAPNLTDRIWLHGGDLASVVESIKSGRNGTMPAHRELLGEDRARLVAAFVLSRKAAAALAAAP